MFTRNDRDAALRSLVPINRLIPEAQRALIAAAEVFPAQAGEIIYIQGQKDDFVHYLLEGEAELLWNGKTLQQVTAASKAAHRAIDPPGRKQHTFRAVTDCMVARFRREDVERAVEQNPGGIGAKELEVSEIAAEVSSNWMIRMLQSPLFAALPATNIQRIFTCLEEVYVQADDVIVKQGTPGDYYYVIENGCCAVTREIAGGRKEIHLADLGPGEAFGEAALISGQPRDATVTMLSDGRLMRMPKADFVALVRKPLLQGLDAAAALEAIEAGAVWLDVRYPEDYARNTLRNSRNLSLNALRIQFGRLHKDDSYVVCAGDPSQAAIGAFLLIERGFTARYLDEPIMSLIAKHPGIALGPPAPEPPERKVINFPTVIGEVAPMSESNEHKEDKEAQMPANEPSPNPFESTLDRIDRLYGTAEAEEGMHRRVPVEAYAETKTGVSLANLIDEIDESQATLTAPHASPALQKTSSPTSPEAILAGVGAVMDRIIGQKQRQEAESPLARASSGPASASTAMKQSPQPDSPLSRTVRPVERNERLPVSSNGRIESVPGDSLRRLLVDFERRLRDYVDHEVTGRGMAMERRHQDKLQRLRQLAIAEVRNRDGQLKQRYEQQYRKKELTLRENYKKLMALANRISEQKAQLQAARRQFEEKVQAANALYRQVEDMRKVLREQLGSFDSRLQQG